MTVLVNSFEGGTSGTTITTGNSGGASGNAWDAVNIIGTGAGLAYDNTFAAHGTLSAKFSYASGQNDGIFLTWSSSIGTPAQVWFRIYAYHTAYPPLDTRIWQVDGTGLNGAVYLTASGNLRFDNSGGGQMVITAASVPLSAWYRLEGFLTCSATVGQCELKLYTSPDSTTPAETDTSAANQNTGTSPSNYRFGDFAGTTQTSAWSWWLDDAGLSSTGYIGPAVSFLAPPNRPRGQAVNRASTY